MTKKDWLLLFIKILGLYIIAIHLGMFITTISSLIVVLIQNHNFQALPSPAWQTPLSTGLVITLGLFMACKSDAVAEMISGDEKP